MTTLDTRPDFFATAAWVGDLVQGVSTDQLTSPTPCSDWKVRDLLEHMVVVLDGMATIGQGGDPFTNPETLPDVADDQWSARFAEALAAVKQVWSDDAVLTREITAPFGVMPGAQIVGFYIIEFLVHGWDLAQATDQNAEAPEDLAQRTLGIAQMVVPAEARTSGAPFDTPVEPRPEAGPTEQLANWLGRTT